MSGKRPSGDNIMQQHECPHCEPFDALAEKVDCMDKKMTMIWGPNGSSEPARNSIIRTIQDEVRDNRKFYLRLGLVILSVECLNLLGGNATGLVKIIQALK